METDRANWVDWIQKRWLDWLVAVVLLGLFSLAVRGSTAAYAGDFFSPGWQPWWDGFLQNSGTEMLGAFLTFVLLELIRGRRERRYQEEAEDRRTKATQELLRNFMQAQELARLRAAETPEERQPILNSMMVTGLLQGANLYNADLRRAWLFIPELQSRKLYLSKRPGTQLFKFRSIGANLQRANLHAANLEGADLFLANLQGACLWNANFKDTSLARTNMGEADLRGVSNFTCEQLQKVETLEGATLPDGTELPNNDTWRKVLKEWCENVEMATDLLGNQYAKIDDDQGFDHNDDNG